MVSERSSVLENLERNSKILLKNYQNEITDVIVFGSVLKEKSRPKDVDICILFKGISQESVGKILSEIKNKFAEKVHISWMFADDMFANALSKTLIEEGYSLNKGRFLHEILGYESGAIFSFRLDKLKKNQKVLFSYALHGKKKGEGMLEMTNGSELGRATIFIPIGKSEDFREFLERWDINFKMRKVLLE